MITSSAFLRSGFNQPSLRDVLIEEPTLHLMPKVKGGVIFTRPGMRFRFHCPRQHNDLAPSPASPLSLGHRNLSLSVARGGRTEIRFFQ